LLERARSHAERILAADPELAQPEHALLIEALGGDGGVHAAPIPA
jgi:hypothetical protein